jgi:hypothetical protein
VNVIFTLFQKWGCDIDNLLNTNNFLVTNVQNDFSIEALTPNIFSSSSNLTSSSVITIVTTLGFNHSKHTIKSGITILASYLNVNLITSHVPPNFSQCAKPGNVDPT